MLLQVRTPLNSVCMGLKLLQEEVSSMLSVTMTADKETQLQYCQATTGKDSKSIVHARKDKAQDVINLAQQILSSAGNAVDVLNDVLNYVSRAM